MFRHIAFFPTEANLIAALKKGQERAQQAVYDRYAGKMLAVCVRYCGNPNDAEEVLMDGFLKVFDKIEQFRSEGSFEGWIRRIMVTESLMFLRRNRSLRQEIPLDDSLAEPDYAQADSWLQTADLLRMVAQLPDGYRAVFNLYAIEGYTHPEIADLLGISEGTSKSQLSRARALLQQRIGQAEPSQNHYETYTRQASR